MGWWMWWRVGWWKGRIVGEGGAGGVFRRGVGRAFCGVVGGDAGERGVVRGRIVGRRCGIGEKSECRNRFFDIFAKQPSQVGFVETFFIPIFADVSWKRPGV